MTLKPIGRLGAASPGGLALPSATPSPVNLYAPRGVALRDGRLAVCDSGNHRVLVWQVPYDRASPAAEIVLGQADFTCEGPAAAGRGPENGFHLPTGILFVDGRLVVADAWHHRILVWRGVPDASDTPPDYAIGQADLSATLPNRGGGPGLDTLYWPYGIGWIAGRFYVADTGNRRILVWDGFPDADRPADACFGQPAPDAREENRGGPVGPCSFRWPHDFAGNDEWLFVADAGNHRILGWRGHPDRDRPADVVLGQPTMEEAREFPYDAQGPCRLRFPYGIALWHMWLAVADTANNRILFWKLPLEEPFGPPASEVLGQHDFAGNGENRWDAVAPDSLCWPYGLDLAGGHLAVADSGNNRVVLWDCRDLVEKELADVPGGAGSSRIDL